MEVKEFVKNILKEVTEAVDESNDERAGFHLMNSSAEGIDFDLAVVSKKEGKGKIGAEGELFCLRKDIYDRDLAK